MVEELNLDKETVNHSEIDFVHRTKGVNCGPMLGFFTMTAPAHSALSVKWLLTKYSVTQLNHLPHSPEKVPNYFWRFLKIKFKLNGQRFTTTEYIQENVTQVLKEIPKEEFQKCCEQWQHFWNKCRPIASQVDYFEGDSIHLDV